MARSLRDGPLMAQNWRISAGETFKNEGTGEEVDIPAGAVVFYLEQKNRPPFDEFMEPYNEASWGRGKTGKNQVFTGYFFVPKKVRKGMSGLMCTLDNKKVVWLLPERVYQNVKTGVPAHASLDEALALLQAH